MLDWNTTRGMRLTVTARAATAPRAVYAVAGSSDCPGESTQNKAFRIGGRGEHRLPVGEVAADNLNPAADVGVQPVGIPQQQPGADARESGA